MDTRAKSSPVVVVESIIVTVAAAVVFIKIVLIESHLTGHFSLTEMSGLQALHDVQAPLALQNKFWSHSRCLRHLFLVVAAVSSSERVDMVAAVVSSGSRQVQTP